MGSVSGALSRYSPPALRFTLGRKLVETRGEEKFFASPVHPALKIRLIWSGGAVMLGECFHPWEDSAGQSITSVLGSLKSASCAQSQFEIPGREMLFKPQVVIWFQSEHTR